MPPSARAKVAHLSASNAQVPRRASELHSADMCVPGHLCCTYGHKYPPLAYRRHLRRRAACPGRAICCTYGVRVPASGVPCVPRTYHAAPGAARRRAGAAWRRIWSGRASRPSGRHSARACMYERTFSLHDGVVAAATRSGGLLPRSEPRDRPPLHTPLRPQGVAPTQGATRGSMLTG